MCACVKTKYKKRVKRNYIKQFEKLISGGGRFKERMSSLLNLLLKLFARGRHCENSKRPFLWLNSETLRLWDPDPPPLTENSNPEITIPRPPFYIKPQTPKSDKDINSQHLRLRDLRQSVGHANWELQMGSFVFWPNFMNFGSFLGSQIRYRTWFSWVYASLFLFTQRQKLFPLAL